VISLGLGSASQWRNQRLLRLGMRVGFQVELQPLLRILPRLEELLLRLHMEHVAPNLPKEEEEEEEEEERQQDIRAQACQRELFERHQSP